MSDINYHAKYLKYKTKYLELLNSTYLGGEKPVADASDNAVADASDNAVADASGNEGAEKEGAEKEGAEKRRC